MTTGRPAYTRFVCTKNKTGAGLGAYSPEDGIKNQNTIDVSSNVWGLQQSLHLLQTPLFGKVPGDGLFHSEEFFFAVEIIEIVFLFDVGRAAMVAERNIAAPGYQRHEGVQVSIDGFPTGAQRHLVHAAHDAQLFAEGLKQFAGVRTGIDLKGEQAVDAALEKIGENGTHVAVAVGPPQVNTGFFQLFVDPLIPRGDNLTEEGDADDGAVVESDIFPTGGRLEGEMRQHLIQEMLNQLTGCLNHILHHLRIIVAGVAEALKGQHIADFTDH